MPDPAPITKTPAAAPLAPKASDPPPASGAVDPPEKPVRPEGFGDALNDYWADDKGADFGRLSNDVAALRTFKAEQDSRLAQVPGDVAEYEVALPEGFKPPEGMDIPADMKFEALADSPLVGPAREFAKKHGLTKDGFKELVALQALGQVAEHKQLEAAAAAERTKLGTKGTERVNAVVAWATAVAGAEHANALLPMMFTAKSIEAFEKIMAVAKAGGPKLSAVGREASQPQKLTEEEYSRLSLTERIERNTALANARKTG